MTSTHVSRSVTDAPNLAAHFLDRVEATPDKEAFRYLEDDACVSVSWQDTADG